MSIAANTKILSKPHNAVGFLLVSLNYALRQEGAV